MNELEKCAEILVECGYAVNHREASVSKGEYLIGVMTGFDQRVQPFTDTIDGRKQADAVEDWLNKEHTSLWLSAYRKVNKNLCDNKHDWRLDRIKWCVQELIR